MIKINLVREGRAVRGAGAAPGMAAAAVAAAGPSNLNNILLVGGLIVGVVIGGGWWVVEKNKLSDRRDQVATKTAEAQRLESIIKEVDEYQKRKDSLQNRIDLINKLKQSQKGPVKIMDHISRKLPDLVWLDRMQMSGGLITISGRGLNPNAIANFVENIKEDCWHDLGAGEQCPATDKVFDEPDLSSLSQVSATPLVYSFEMSFHFTYGPKAEAGAPGTAMGTGTAGTTGTSGTTSTTGSAKK